MIVDTVSMYSTSTARSRVKVMRESFLSERNDSVRFQKFALFRWLN